MIKRFEVCYPGYSKKALTFTLDDGRLEYDGVMIDALREYGIRGTFNLMECNLEKHTADEYRSLYRGYEISNHCKQHPFCFSDGALYDIVEGEFDPESADENKIYEELGSNGLYLIHRPNGWRRITSPSRYIELIGEGQKSLESVFGVGNIRGFVWPFGEQNSKEVHDYLRTAGYYGVRKTGCLEDKTGFDLPADWMRWSYNAHHMNLLEVASLYEEYPDDGRLKMFSFGVHSVDFERAGKWGDVREFGQRLGHRPDEFWYATVGEIYDYTTAASKISLEGDVLYNPTEQDIYIKIDCASGVIKGGERILL